MSTGLTYVGRFDYTNAYQHTIQNDALIGKSVVAFFVDGSLNQEQSATAFRAYAGIGFSTGKMRLLYANNVIQVQSLNFNEINESSFNAETGTIDLGRLSTYEPYYLPDPAMTGSGGSKVAHYRLYAG